MLSGIFDHLYFVLVEIKYSYYCFNAKRRKLNKILLFLMNVRKI